MIFNSFLFLSELSSFTLRHRGVFYLWI